MNPKIPSAIRLIDGHRDKQKQNKKEPKPRRQIPSPPDHLNPKALIIWGRAAAKLDRLGVLTETDDLAFEQVCETYVEVVELLQDIRENGRVQKVVTAKSRAAARSAARDQSLPGDGSPVIDESLLDILERPRPQVAMLADAQRRLSHWFGQFGMTPSTRSNVEANPDDEDQDPAAKYGF